LVLASVLVLPLVLALVLVLAVALALPLPLVLVAAEERELAHKGATSGWRKRAELSNLSLARRGFVRAGAPLAGQRGSRRQPAASERPNFSRAAGHVTQ